MISSESSVPAPVRPERVQSIDILRGAVMVLMAIDHVRVYSGLPPGGPIAANDPAFLVHGFLTQSRVTPCA